MSVTAREVCTLHGVETRLRCATCETPICLRCQVRTEVGLKCPTCAKPAAVPPRRGFTGQPVAMASVAVGIALTILIVALIARSHGSSPGSSPGPAAAPVGRWQQLPDLTSLRGGTTAVVLKDGRALAVGGGIGAIPLAGTEIFDATTHHWTPTGSLLQARRGNSTVLLPDGRALTAGGIAGSRVLSSAEVYDPGSGTWKGIAPMRDPRFDFTLTALTDGRVLAAGGTSRDGRTALKSAEIYDPGRDAWTPAASPMTDARTGARALLLRDGRVLVVGGVAGLDASAGALDTAELFDPAGGVFTRTGSLRQGRQDLTVTLLANGRVLAAGGSDANGTLASAEILDPVTGAWAPTGSMLATRRLHRASLLPSGEVFVSGGEAVQGGERTSLTTAEIYDPAGGTWRPAAPMNCPRSEQAQVTLPNGEVLVLGGDAALPGQPPRAQSCTELFSVS